jgi:hypothetical protein
LDVGGFGECKMQMRNAGHNFATETMIGVTMVCFWLDATFILWSMPGIGHCDQVEFGANWNLGEPKFWNGQQKGLYLAHFHIFIWICIMVMNFTEWSCK